MRVAILAMLCLMTAGCTSDADSDNDVDDALLPHAGLPTPEPIVFTGSLQGVGYGGLSPVGLPVDPLPQCALEEAQCAVHSVEVPVGDWTVTFTLEATQGTASSLTTPAIGYGTDYDLFVEGVGESTNGSGEPDTVQSKLAAGTYNAQVVAWNDADGSYTLTVSFA